MEGICECECHDCDVCGNHAEVRIRELEAKNHQLKVALFDAQQAASTDCSTCKDEGYLSVGVPCTDCRRP